ncbi:MAG: hypothetical protein KQH63_14700 [Desulfobulbaceae bacterium]|nr:hypothetical protein [Desulfobulbaceae bacterium]
MNQQDRALSHNFKKSLTVKAAILLLLACLLFIVIFLVKRYFYILDAYVYTWEFHLLFAVNNLKKANLELYTEYLQSLGALGSLPFLFLAHSIQNVYLPFSKHILFAASTQAFGFPIAIVASLLSFLILGCTSYGIGNFFLGDLVPLVSGEKYKKFRKKMTVSALFFLPATFAVPAIPISLLALLSAFLKIPFIRTIQFMAIGFSIRIIWLAVAG